MYIFRELIYSIFQKQGGITVGFSRKKGFFLISLLLVSVLILSGCGSSNGDSVLETERKKTATSTVNNFLGSILEFSAAEI